MFYEKDGFIPKGGENMTELFIDQDGRVKSLGVSEPYLSQHLFNGHMFQLTQIVTVTTTAYMQVKTGATLSFHTVSRTHAYSGGGPFTIELYESPTLTDGTTPIPVYNMKRQSTNNIQTSFYSDPTGVTGGTLIDVQYLPAQGLGANTIGGTTVGVERVLKKNTNYVLKITNGGASSTFYTSIVMYEHTD